MIKNFKQFKEDISKDLDILSNFRDRVIDKENEMDKKYKDDLVKSISNILNALSEKGKSHSINDLLERKGLIPDAEDMAVMLREIEVNYYGNYYIISDIIKRSDVWKVKLNISEYDEEEVYIGHIRSKTLFEILNLLLEYTSGVLNAELYKNLNK